MNEADFDPQARVRQVQIEAAPLSKRVRAYTMLSHRWLDHDAERLCKSDDPLLMEALDIVSHDCAFVAVKLHRALHGRDRHAHDAADGDPVQNDWNGSAMAALISLERSETAWRALAHATSDPVAVMLADAARDLQRLALEEFPHARSFVRPGFDEPWR
jgi:hypothetical protein